MAFAREIFVQIKNKIPFKQSEKEKDSHYAYVGNSIVRISNHCTWMYIWDEILEQNPKDKGKPIISLVFEDEGSTFDERCLLLKRFRKNPIKVQEFVFPIHGNGQYISSEDIKYIIESLFAVQQGGIYKDRTGKCEFFQRISKSPEDSGSVPQQQITNENKQYRNTTTTMKKKQTIKLNEGCAVQLPEKYRGIEYEIRKELSQWYNHIGYKYTKRTSFPKDTINYIIYAVLSDSVKGYQDVSLDKVETDAKINENKNSNKMKQTIKLNESQLRNIIKESIKKVLKENVKTDIFTIDAFDIQDEESVDVMRYTGVDYESEEEAISAARELAQSLSSRDNNVIIVSVYAGQYNDGKGNVFGEPFDIYAISNKDKNTTMIARKNAGYTSLEVDEYIAN